MAKIIKFPRKEPPTSYRVAMLVWIDRVASSQEEAIEVAQFIVHHAMADVTACEFEVMGIQEVECGEA